MNKTVVGALLIFILIVAGALCVKFISPYIEDRQQRITSDASKTKGTIRLDLDNWTGYYPLRSQEMKKMLRKSGYVLEVNDDNADYAARMKRLENGDIDFAVATVDSYILNGVRENFPGTIVMVIDESKGGDAILSKKGMIDSLDKIKNLQGVSVAFTPDSPSHHLAKAAAYHFGVKSLLPEGDAKIETDGSKAACDLLLDGRTDVAICWEPDVSRAIESGKVVKLLGTEDTQKLIVDILLVNRRLASKKPELVEMFIDSYFKILKIYRDNPDQLKKEVKQETGLSKTMVASMLKGVSWVNFDANCRLWFGISPAGGKSEEGLINTIESTVNILVNTGDFNETPIPGKDPYRLTNSSFLKKLHAKNFAGFTKAGEPGNTSGDSLSASFSKLGKNQWAALKDVGTLKIEPVSFQRGTSDLDLLGKQVIDSMVAKLRHYPNFRIKINAHTGVRGDKKANRKLSQLRADAVDLYLKEKFSIDANRTLATGYGGEKPLNRLQGESRRTWLYRLPRVGIALVKEVY